MQIVRDGVETKTPRLSACTAIHSVQCSAHDRRQVLDVFVIEWMDSLQGIDGLVNSRVCVCEETPWEEGKKDQAKKT